MKLRDSVYRRQRQGSRLPRAGVLVVAWFVASLLPPYSHGQIQKLPVLGQIGGINRAVAVSGPLAVLGEGIALRVMDVSDPALPVTLARIFLPGIAERIAIDDGLVVATLDSLYAGLAIVDISNPNAAELTGTVTEIARTNGLALRDGIVYVGSGRGLDIYDLRIPGAPTNLATHPTSESPWDIELVGDLAYLSIAGGDVTGDGLRIVDISNPASPQELSQYRPTLVSANSAILGTRVRGNFAFLAVKNLVTSGILVVDITDPENPLEDSFFPVVSNTKKLSDFDSSTIVLSGESSGFVFVDVTDPQNLVEIGSIPSSDARDIAVQGTVVYLAEANAGSSIQEVSNLQAPVTLSSIADLPRRLKHIEVQGAIVTAAANRLWTLDVSEPGNPITLFEEPGSTEQAHGLDVSGQYTYIATNNGRFLVYDISDPMAPLELSNIAYTPEFGRRSLRVQGSYAYVTDNPVLASANGLTIFDVGDPANPVVVSFYQTPGNAFSVFIGDRVAYVADDLAGLTVIDVSNPTSPFLAGTFTAVPAGISHATVDGDIAYLSSGTGVQAVDISNPSAMVEIGTEYSGIVEATEVRSSIAYATSTNGMRLIDIRDPAQMQVVAILESELGLVGESTNVVVNNFAYMAGRWGGFITVAVPPPAPVVDPVVRFINSDTVTVTGNVASPGEFVTVGGGAFPVFQQLAEGETAFSIDVQLKQEAVNILSVTTMNEFGLVSLPALAPVVEGVAYPATLETLTSLAITPDPAGPVALNAPLSFTATATFSDTSTADVTQFVELVDFLTNSANQWTVTNGELITSGGLYVNTKPGPAQIQATVTGVASNLVTIGDAK